MNTVEITANNFLQALKNNVLSVATGSYMDMFSKVAASIVALLLAIELFKVALKLVSGSGFDIWPIITYAFVAVFIVGYPKIVKAINSSEFLISEEIINTTLQYKNDSANLLAQYIEIQQAKEAEEDVSWYDISGHIDKLGVALAFMVVQVMNSITMFIIDFLYASQYFAFMMILMVGPMFIAFGVSDLTRSLCMGWIGNVLGYFLVMIFMAVAAKMVYVINIDSIKTMTIEGTPGWSAIIPAIGRALIAGGLAIAVPKAGKSLAGIMGGGGGAMTAALGGGVAMMKGAEAGRQGIKNMKESHGARSQARGMTEEAKNMVASGNAAGALQLANQAAGLSMASRSAGAKKAYMAAAKECTNIVMKGQGVGGTTKGNPGGSVNKEANTVSASASGNAATKSYSRGDNQTINESGNRQGQTQTQGNYSRSESVSAGGSKESGKGIENAFDKAVQIIKDEAGD